MESAGEHELDLGRPFLDRIRLGLASLVVLFERKSILVSKRKSEKNKEKY